MTIFILIHLLKHISDSFFANYPCNLLTDVKRSDEKEQAMERIQEWNGMSDGLAFQSKKWIHHVIAIDHRSNAYSKLT